MAYGRQEPGEPYRRISVQEALQMQFEGALVVDVRRADEWKGGHARGAVHLPVDDMLTRAEAELPKDRDLLFICAAGVRSGLAAEMAAALGFDSAHLYNIEEGTPVWIRAGQPADQG
ncbi:MAG: rhodanese-like domain-containing protein [Chloroflexota bacterium]